MLAKSCLLSTCTTDLVLSLKYIVMATMTLNCPQCYVGGELHKNTPIELDLFPVVSLIHGSSTPLSRLATTDIDILIQRIEGVRRLWHVESVFYLFINQAAYVLVNSLRFVLGENTPVNQFAPEVGNRVVRSMCLQFLSGSICDAWIGH